MSAVGQERALDAHRNALRASVLRGDPAPIIREHADYMLTHGASWERELVGETLTLLARLGRI